VTRTPKHVTVCTVCEREVGVVENWNNLHAGRGGEWKISRHAVTPHRERPVRLCTGGGINVSPNVVMSTATLEGLGGPPPGGVRLSA
jgi:hypothetical protein